MLGLEIVLVIIGFACICISFFVSGKKSEVSFEAEGVQSSAVWSEKEEQLIRDRVSKIMDERQNEIIESTEDQMSRLCNEKIMAVDEFSQQLLEKIESNHQEVVFMYNMLNEKEKEIQHMILDVSKEPHIVEDKKASVVTKKVEIEEEEQPGELEILKVEEGPEVPTKEPLTAIEVMNARIRAEKKVSKGTGKRNPAVKKTEQTSSVQVRREQGKQSSQTENVNVQIQKLYKEGKSVLDISKELNIGQGEVKLVIALYGGRK